MSIGANSIGAVAAGELGGGDDAIVFAPSVAAAVSSTVPVIFGGASALPSAANVTVAAASPVIASGVYIAPPPASVAIAAGATGISISATVAAPSADIVVSASPPALHAGASVTVPSATVSASASVPAIHAGVSVLPAAAQITVAPEAPGISISATIHPPAVDLTVSAPAPAITGGNYIEAVNTVTMITEYGEIGSASIGHFAIGEGEQSTRVAKIPPIVVVKIANPMIYAGKSVFPPAANVSAISPRPEIDGRGRKLRILAIAS